jgi:hypothetical protein
VADVLDGTAHATVGLNARRVSSVMIEPHKDHLHERSNYFRREAEVAASVFIEAIPEGYPETSAILRHRLRERLQSLERESPTLVTSWHWPTNQGWAGRGVHLVWSGG